MSCKMSTSFDKKIYRSLREYAFFVRVKKYRKKMNQNIIKSVNGVEREKVLSTFFQRKWPVRRGPAGGIIFIL